MYHRWYMYYGLRTTELLCQLPCSSKAMASESSGCKVFFPFFNFSPIPNSPFLPSLHISAKPITTWLLLILKAANKAIYTCFWHWFMMCSILNTSQFIYAFCDKMHLNILNRLMGHIPMQRMVNGKSHFYIYAFHQPASRRIASASITLAICYSNCE